MRFFTEPLNDMRWRRNIRVPDAEADYIFAIRFPFCDFSADFHKQIRR
jgi:hypothetical protein